VSKTPDSLESELAAVRPRPVSADLRRRVGERLSVSPGPRRWLWGLTLVGVLVAVGVVIFITPRREPPAPPTRPEVIPAPAVVPESESPGPTVLAYQRALARSPEELTALLDRHAAAAPEPVPITAFTRSNATLDALIGDD
jgi:hypothetical protein